MADPIGIDFGGSGIKAAPVDLSTGEFSADRERIDTPEESSPKAVAKVMAELLEALRGQPLRRGRHDPGRRTQGRRGGLGRQHRQELDRHRRRRPAQRRSSAARCTSSTTPTRPAWPRRGTASPAAATGSIIVTTLGTGIGSALLYDGVLVPNTELGHLEIEGHDAESRAANSARKNEDLSWEKWAKRLTTYYRTMEKLFSPDLIVVGGGVSKHGQRVHPAHRDRHRDHLRHPAQHRRHRRRRRAGQPTSRSEPRTRWFGRLTPRSTPPRG